MNIVIAAGGTGGHINPGIAIAQEIRRNKPYANIIFIGASYGLEKELIPKAGFEIRIIHSRGFSKNVGKMIRACYENVRGMFDTYKILKEIKPDIAIGTGGYVCAPVLFVAKKICKIPVFIHESNAIAGKTNKFIGRFADGVAVGFEVAKKEFKNKNIVFTGNPIKREIADINKTEENEKKTVLIFGGSQGAKAINNAAIELIAEYKGNAPYKIVYATGMKQYDAVMTELLERDIKLNDSIEIKPYIHNMSETLKEVDLVVSRAGALTVSELCAVGIPAILIPLPTAAENHQEFNAKVMQDAGAGKIIFENELSSINLMAAIEGMLSKDLVSMGNKAKMLMPKNGAENFYKMTEKYIDSIKEKE